MMSIISSPMILVYGVLQVQMHLGRFARASAVWGGCSRLGTQPDGHGSQMLPSFSRSGLRYTHPSLGDHRIIELSALEVTPKGHLVSLPAMKRDFTAPSVLRAPAA